MENTLETLTRSGVGRPLDFAQFDGGGDVVLGLEARAGRMPISDLRIEPLVGHGSSLVWLSADGQTEMVALEHASAIEQAALSTAGLVLAEMTSDGFDESSVQVVRVEADRREVHRG